MNETIKKQIVEQLLKKRVLVTKELLQKLEKQKQAINEQLTEKKEQNFNEIENNNVEIIQSYIGVSKKYTVQDFISYFTNRLKAIEKILHQHQELQNITSISRILQKSEKEQINIIGIVFEKQFTKNQNIILTIEDRSGQIKAVISKNNPQYEEAKSIVNDEVIGIQGVTGDKIIFIQNIIFPGIPLIQEIKKCPDEVYAVVLSDIHVGSIYFLEKEFERFIRWINSEIGTQEQKNIAQKVKYIFIVGDLVDGVGIYPNQQKELNIPDIYKQYEKLVEYLHKIPKDKKLIICPGNHDALRLSEPQPPLNNNFVESLNSLNNAYLVTNPAYIRIHKTKEFPGFTFLLYHGYSYDYYGDNVESIRNSGRHISDRVELIMKYLLQKRHLAPTHASSLYIPDSKIDPLIIDKVPDFFLSGHIHKANIGNYRGVITISSSCWQAKTDFQEKVGHEPEPCKIPIINLQNRKVTLMNFAENDRTNIPIN
ncbi:metallophosphoesterase [Candidatus Woesearchaeota archaeon]|nr:metallophosphoesterase [Candidatus Woesearchaeota archaeon]